ncbi:response regulator [Paenibacillus psychroresistens]|uniref:Response regulator n=1 Tax=Paenibacillus psychroresistens TaxID=1778678 RepID=A0A6B8RLR7_9BACL|nr:response regulator [Paenibacillus psychroresistens]QGQ96376.1 response regulator [Paenibacillus psychroresistens]
MLKLLVVEDEPSVREGIITMIDWHKFDITIVGACADGKEAWRFIQKDCPDLLLSDIRMPLITGLELVERINEANLDIMTVFLSGYDDFQYAKQALQLGVFDYILKPCQPKQIRDVMVRAQTELLLRRNKDLQFNLLERQMKVHSQTIKEDRMLKWLRSAPRNKAARLSEITECHMQLEDKVCLVMVLQFDSKKLKTLHYNENDLHLIRYAAANIMLESLHGYFNGRLEIMTQKEEFILIANAVDSNEVDLLKGTLFAVQKNLTDFLKVTVSIGVGSEVDIIEIQRSYDEALEILANRFYYGGGEIFIYSEGKVQDHFSKVYSSFQEQISDFQSKINEYIAKCNFSDFVIEVEEWLNAFQEQELSIQRIHLHAYSFVNMLIKVVNTGNDSFLKEHIALFEKYAEQIEYQETFEELSTLLTIIIQKMVELMNAQKPTHKTIEHVMALIKEKYMTNLTLKSIAEEVFISPSHLSTLFRQEMGINFLDCLHQFRIEKAKQLLKEENGKIYIIAKQVGYYDESHFVRMFKKWTGMLPSQYKK